MDKETGEDGEYILRDLCIMSVNMTQKKTWQEKYPIKTLIPSGAAGRLIIIDPDNYEINDDKVYNDNSYNELKELTKKCFELKYKVTEEVGSEIKCNSNFFAGEEQKKDIAGEIYDDVMSDDMIRKICKIEDYPDGEMRGKLIEQALKLTAITNFAKLDDDKIKVIASSKFVDSPGVDVGEANGGVLFDRLTFRTWFSFLLRNFLAELRMPAGLDRDEIIKEKIIDKLRVAKEGYITTNSLRKLAYNMKNTNFDYEACKEQVEQAIEKLSGEEKIEVYKEETNGGPSERIRLKL